MSKQKFIRRRIIAAVALVAILGGGISLYANRGLVRSGIEQFLGNDFPGPGHGEALVTIEEGFGGSEVATALVDAGVVKSFQTTYKLILDTNPSFFPGTYRLKLEMSSRQALVALADPASAVVSRTVIREGLRAKAIFETLSTDTGVPLADFEALFKSPTEFGLSASLPNIEGYLFPATYSFAPGQGAKQILQAMVDRMRVEIEKFGIPASKVHEVLTMASIIQKEARLEPDFYKVSATFYNRLAIGMAFQSDATVSYGVNGSTVSTTDAERADDNGYNTYLYPGLPIGPISAPGALAIDAALNPAQGDWLYFCTINLETGETVFSETLAEHERAVAQWLAWMKENPDYE
ncbi:MAG: hypothetical protein RIS82_1184 [Actinomycetota bacterium]|jgi:UPF0755 protein